MNRNVQSQLGATIAFEAKTNFRNKGASSSSPVASCPLSHDLHGLLFFLPHEFHALFSFLPHDLISFLLMAASELAVPRRNGRGGGGGGGGDLWRERESGEQEEKGV